MSKSYWLIDPTKHNKEVLVGNGYKIPDDYMFEDEPSPFRGLEVTVMWINTFSKAGYDCFVKLHCSPEELAMRYSLIFGSKYTVEEVVGWHGHENFSTSKYQYHPGLYIEHSTFDLERIEHNNEHVLILSLAHDKSTGDEVKALFTREDGEFNVRYEEYTPTVESFKRVIRLLEHGQLKYLSSSAGVDHIVVEYITKYNIEHHGKKANG